MELSMRYPRSLIGYAAVRDLHPDASFAAIILVCAQFETVEHRFMRHVARKRSPDDVSYLTFSLLESGGRKHPDIGRIGRSWVGARSRFGT
jgi:hypothetical protein